MTGEAGKVEEDPKDPGCEFSFSECDERESYIIPLLLSSSIFLSSITLLFLPVMC